MPIRRCLTLAAAAALLSGCISTESQDFAVTGAAPSPPGTVFRSTDPNVNDVEAKGYCAAGYEKLGEQTVATEDGGTLQEWRVRCIPYGTLSWLPFM
ncbi:MAG TPA: hypothetical protein VKS60_19685 [Stellaceae bacterium]|nr:hypothetical protein [Stellaceae bacterium]